MLSTETHVWVKVLFPQRWQYLPSCFTNVECVRTNTTRVYQLSFLSPVESPACPAAAPRPPSLSHRLILQKTNHPFLDYSVYTHLWSYKYLYPQLATRTWCSGCRDPIDWSNPALVFCTPHHSPRANDIATVRRSDLSANSAATWCYQNLWRIKWPWCRPTNQLIKVHILNPFSSFYKV